MKVTSSNFPFSQSVSVYYYQLRIITLLLLYSIVKYFIHNNRLTFFFVHTNSVDRTSLAEMYLQLKLFLFYFHVLEFKWQSQVGVRALYILQYIGSVQRSTKLCHFDVSSQKYKRNSLFTSVKACQLILIKTDHGRVN